MVERDASGRFVSGGGGGGSARRTRAIDVTKDLQAFVERAMRRLQLRVFQALTSASPVDTGFFRAGWSPSTGSRQTGPADPPPQRQQAESQAATLFAKNSSEAARIATAYRLAAGPIFIVNGVSYGVFLNGGSSAQAPAMFVEQAIATGVQATQREIGLRF